MMAVNQQFHPRRPQVQRPLLFFTISLLLLSGVTQQASSLSLLPETKYTLQLNGRDFDTNFDFNSGVSHTTTRQAATALLAADRISGCHLALCPDSNCFSSLLFQIGPRIATDFCQFGPVESNGSFVSLVASMGLEYVFMAANITDFRNISLVSLKTLPIQGSSRGLSIVANATTGLPVVLLPAANQFKIYECLSWECDALTSRTIWANETLPAAASSWLLRGAIQNSSFGLSLLTEDPISGKVFYIHCPSVDLAASACGNFSVTEVSVAGNFINPSTNRFGMRQLVWDANSQSPWIFIPTTTSILVLRCDDLACSSRSTIRTVPLATDASALTQPDWVVLDSGMLLVLPQTLKSSAIIEIARCPLDSSKACDRATAWSGSAQYGASLKYSSTTGVVQLITSTAESQWSGVTVADVSDCHNSDTVISSTQTAGRCLACPAGTVRRNSTSCSVCDRAAGFGSPGGSPTSCSSCASGPLTEYCAKCPDGWQRMSSTNALCSRCSSYSYSNPATGSKCTSCPTTWLLLSDFSRCLPDNSSIALVSAKCSQPDWARAPSCVGDSAWTGSDDSLGAVCVKSKCVCVEGWRWFNGLCYPPLSQNSICIPLPVSSRHGLFRPRMSELKRLPDGSVEVSFAMPLESYSNMNGTGRVLKTEINWTIGGATQTSQCDFPSGTTNVFFSKGTEYPQCEELVSTKFAVSAVRRCPWLGRFSTDGATVFQIAYFNITRTYLFHDIGSQTSWTETRSALLNLELDSPNVLKAPVTIDDRLLGGETPNWVLIGILVGFGVICIVIFIVAFVLFRRARLAAAAEAEAAAATEQNNKRSQANGEQESQIPHLGSEDSSTEEEDEEFEEYDEKEEQEEEEEEEEGAKSETESTPENYEESEEEESEDEDAEEDLFACPERCGAYVAPSQMQAHLQVCKVRLRQQQPQQQAQQPQAESEIPMARLGALATANQAESNMVDLNISDTHFRISKAALTKYPNSLLGYLFSEYTEPKPQVDSSGAVIIDRSPEPYRIILPWLQSGVLPSFLDRYAAVSLLNELSFLRLNEMIYSMRGFLLTGMSLPEQNFSGMDLRGYNLERSNVQGADFSNANLHGANLRNSDMRNCNLSGADLSGADLSDANLSGANLRGASLEGAKLDSYNLIGCEMSDDNNDDHHEETESDSM